MNQRSWWRIAAGCGFVVVLCVGAIVVTRVRQPVAAGFFYPADPAQLRAAVEQYMAEAPMPAIEGRYLGCLAPHSAFPYSGAVAAGAFKPLLEGQYDRVIILASSHFAEFRGCSIPSVQYYRTPLGDVELDGPAISRLQWCPLIDTRSVTHRQAKSNLDGTRRIPVHEVEYSIELVLPFLQARLGRFKLVPILVSSMKGYDEGTDVEGIKATAEALRQIIDDRTFVVVSSDLTHFGNVYAFRPFGTDIEANIEQLDLDALDTMRALSRPAFDKYLRMTGNNICGSMAIEIFLALMPRRTESLLIDHRMSSQVTGNLDQSVSYASMAFFLPDEPPAESRPVVAPPPVHVESLILKQLEAMKERERKGAEQAAAQHVEEGKTEEPDANADKAARGEEVKEKRRKGWFTRKKD